ncbi:hypothetical protein ACTFIT_011010 [Dictyostelium discoideum]
MNNHFKFYFIILLCSIFYISFSESQTIGEYNCLYNIFEKFNLTKAYPKNSTDGYSNVCESAGILCEGGVVKSIIITGKNEQSPLSAVLTPNELSCLPNLVSISLISIRVNTDVLFTKIGSEQLILLKLTDHSLHMTLISYHGSYVYFNVNEGTNFTNPKVIQLWALNIPDLSSCPLLGLVNLFLRSDYNKTTLSNYAKINSTLVQINFPQNSLPIPSFIETNRDILGVSIVDQPFSKPSSVIDMSVGYKLQLFSSNNIGPDFNINGEFPIKFSNTVTNIYIRFGSFKTIPVFSNVSTGSVTIANSGLTDLSIYGGSAKILDYSDNTLTGTIDKSYCNVELIVANNNLTGTIPSCFTCYFGYPITNAGIWSKIPFYERFKGNFFTNYIPNPGCTTFAPQVRANSILSGYIISGIDIGFDGQSYKFNGTEPCYFPSFRLGKEINCIVNNNYLANVRYASILNTWHNTNYTFAFISSPPDASLVSVSLNTLTIDGTYFSSYMGQSIQTVKIANINCAISATNFFKIVCTTLSTIPSTSDSQLLTISNSNETKNFYIQTSDGYSNSKTCPNDCSTNSKGICDLSTGICVCNIGFGGNDCSSVQCFDQNCSGFGICNITTGECKCDSSHQGDDCSLPFIPCKSDCSQYLNQGSCNNQTGICQCSTNYQGSDCAIPIVNITSVIPCTIDGGEVSIIGWFGSDNTLTLASYNVSIGILDCIITSINQTVIKCNLGAGEGTKDIKTINSIHPNVTYIAYGLFKYQTPVHYITSVIPCTIDGGEVSIIGWFGNGALSLTSFIVSIGVLDCIITSINQTVITCNVGAGKGTKDIKIINSIHPNIVFIGYGLFNYQNPIKTCPNDCTSPKNGKCNSNTGECECNDPFKGFDCSTKIEITTPPTNSSIDKDTGGATIGNQNTNYEISILSLNEISIDGSTIIKSHPLNGNWSIDNKETKTTSDSNIFIFSQKLINNTCTINYTIEEVKLKDKSFTFGTTTFTVEKGSIKLSVLIKDYQYQSSLNTLQLIFYSGAVDTNDDDDCNKKETTINTSNLNNQQNLNYIQISKNSKTLVGRFINQVIADSRPTFMSSTIINDNNNNNKSSIKIGLNLPHCKNQCLIDPDFSVLVNSDFKESCDKSQKNKWIIPVSVVVSVVGFSIIITISIIIYIKHKYRFKIISTKLKPFRNPK